MRRIASCREQPCLSRMSWMRWCRGRVTFSAPSPLPRDRLAGRNRTATEMLKRTSSKGAPELASGSGLHMRPSRHGGGTRALPARRPCTHRAAAGTASAREQRPARACGAMSGTRPAPRLARASRRPGARVRSGARRRSRVTFPMPRPAALPLRRKCLGRCPAAVARGSPEEDPMLAGPNTAL
eukprot:scaffold6593_cov100-Isochrysis_galbana.AAC.4